MIGCHHAVPPVGDTCEDALSWLVARLTVGAIGVQAGLAAALAEQGVGGTGGGEGQGVGAVDQLVGGGVGGQVEVVGLEGVGCWGHEQGLVQSDGEVLDQTGRGETW